MDEIIKSIKLLEDLGSIVDRISETVKNEIKDEKCGFLSMLLVTLGASVMGNMSIEKGVTRAGKSVIRAGKTKVGARMGVMTTNGAGPKKAGINMHHMSQKS